MPISLQVLMIRKAISPLFAINIFLNIEHNLKFGILNLKWFWAINVAQKISFKIHYDGSTKNKGWSNSTGEESSTNILTILPETSDSISLKSFIASITQRTSPWLMVLPTSTKGGLSGDGFL